ncbi:MAG: hypothetical protein ACFNOP_04170, partial [Bacteroides sp.]
LWGAGESSRCEDDTRPYSRHCGEIVGGITAPTIIYAHVMRASTGTAWRRITTRHAASLRPPKNGENRF